MVEAKPDLKFEGTNVETKMYDAEDPTTLFSAWL